MRGKVEKNWSVEHAVHIQKWNDRDEYVYNALRMEEVMSRHHPYMVWYRRITRLYINHASAKMEISVMCINLFWYLHIVFDVILVSYFIMPVI